MRAHSVRSQRPGLRWIAGAAGLGLAGATLLAATAAQASSGSDVTAVFSVTGVSTSNCKVSTGGADVYIEPGAELDAKSSAVGLTVLGQQLNTSQVAGFTGKLVIDPGTSHVTKYNLTTDKLARINGLTSGNHKFTWTASNLTVLGQSVPLGLDAQAVKAGGQLAYAGTIHVTSAAPNCGIAVQVPGPGVSVSVTKLPPVKVSLPPVNVSVPVDPGKVSLPTPKLPISLPGSSKSSKGGFNYTPPPPTVPEQVVPKGHGGTFLGDGSGYFGGALPDVGSTPSQTDNSTAGPSSNGPVAQSANTPKTNNDAALKKKAKNAQLAADPSPSAQLPVILAILAVIALALVTATYARLYLVRKQG